MSNETKISLRNVLTVLSIAVILCTVVGGAYIAYDNTKEAKRDIDNIKSRIIAVELKQEKFEGIIEERTRNTQADVKEIKSDMKILLHRLELNNGG